MAGPLAWLRIGYRQYLDFEQSRFWLSNEQVGHEMAAQFKLVIRQDVG